MFRVYGISMAFLGLIALLNFFADVFIPAGRAIDGWDEAGSAAFALAVIDTIVVGVLLFLRART